MTAIEGKRLAIVIQTVSGPLSFRSQPLLPLCQGLYLIWQEWSDGRISVCINGQVIQESDEPCVVPARQRTPLFGPHALLHPDALQVCEPWVERRRAFFGRFPGPSSKQREKTQNEQFHEFVQELEFLERELNGKRAGDKPHIGKLAGSLRNLLYWSIKNDGHPHTNYNPMLLRLASWFEFPLPVYADPVNRMTFPKVPFEVAVFDNIPSMVRNRPGQQLVDIQQWLDACVALGGPSEMLGQDFLAAKDVICQASNSYGGSHLDAGVGKGVDYLQRLAGPGNDILSQFLIAVANVVVTVGQMVCIWARNFRFGASMVSIGALPEFSIMSPLVMDDRYVTSTRLPCVHQDSSADRVESTTIVSDARNMEASHARTYFMEE